MGSGIAKVLQQREGIEIVGVCEREGKENVKRIQSILGEGFDAIYSDMDELLKNNKADLAMIYTDSFTAKIFDKIKLVIEHKVNVICTAEEMAYPKANEPEITRKMDKIAKEFGVTILGTGINPGLMMDLLVITLSKACTDLKHIEARRVNSLSPFGKTVMQEQGVGMSVDDFNKQMEEGTLAGHVGFKESVYMMSDAMGLSIDDFEQQMKPIITDVDRKSEHGFAKAGDVAGVNMTAQGLSSGQVIIDMHHPQQIEPEQFGTKTGDYITIKGVPNIQMSVQPEIDGGIGTIAMYVNMIPQVLNARPGLKTMIDLPVPRIIMDDY